MQDNQNLTENSVEPTKKHYELLVPLQWTTEQINNLDIVLLERIGITKLKNPTGPDLADTLGTKYLIFCTPEQAQKASLLPLVESVQEYQPLYPREEIQSILGKNIELNIEFLCTISSLLEQHLKKYMALEKAASYKIESGLEKLGIFSFKANKPDDIKVIDEIAKIEEVRSVEYNSAFTCNV